MAGAKLDHAGETGGHEPVRGDDRGGAGVKRVASKMEHVDWEQRFERMPDNAPPKWMFRNISAIGENTERILEVLERQHPDLTGQVTASPESQS